MPDCHVASLYVLQRSTQQTTNYIYKLQSGDLIKRSKGADIQRHQHCVWKTSDTQVSF